MCDEAFTSLQSMGRTCFQIAQETWVFSKGPEAEGKDLIYSLPTWKLSEKFHNKVRKKGGGGLEIRQVNVGLRDDPA